MLHTPTEILLSGSGDLERRSHLFMFDIGAAFLVGDDADDFEPGVQVGVEYQYAPLATLRTLFRAGFFVPSVVSMVVISLIWKHLYAPFGGMNALLGLLGLPPQRWLLDPELALPAVMAMDVWASVGYYMVLYLAGLENIPGELYEAASLDGAGFWARLRHVTWPALKPMTLFLFTGRNITGDLRGANELPFGIPDGRNRQRHVKAFAILTNPLRLEVLNALSML